MLKEYSDVFKGIGTLPGGPYHIRLKEQYKLVQHPPQICTSGHARCIHSRTREADKRGHNYGGQGTHRVDQLHSASNEIKWQSKTVPQSKRLEQSY